MQPVQCTLIDEYLGRVKHLYYKILTEHTQNQSIFFEFQISLPELLKQTSHNTNGWQYCTWTVHVFHAEYNIISLLASTTQTSTMATASAQQPSSGSYGIPHDAKKQGWGTKKGWNPSDQGSLKGKNSTPPKNSKPHSTSRTEDQSFQARSRLSRDVNVSFL